MKFKTWFVGYGGGMGAATTGMHGGIIDPVRTNDNMPYGVRSKYATKEGGKEDTDPQVNPDKLFGIRKPNDMKRQVKGINKGTGTGVPLRVDRPDIP